MSRTLSFCSLRIFQRSIYSSSRTFRPDIDSSKMASIVDLSTPLPEINAADNRTITRPEPKTAPKEQNRAPLAKARKGTGLNIRKVVAPRQDGDYLVRPVVEPSSLASVTYATEQGSTTRPVQVSARTSPDDLTAALPKLLSTSYKDDRPVSISSDQSWDLSSRGDVLHRVLSFKTEYEMLQVIKKISSHAQTVKHHPHSASRSPHKITGNAWVGK